MFIFTKIYYDPLDRNCRTELPDCSFTRTEWTAWEQQIWDNNDTVLENEWYLARKDGQMGAEEKDAALKAAAHADTPTIIHMDTFARGFYTIQYCTPLNSPPLEGCPPGGVVHSYETLDIQNNRLSVVDGRGLMPLQYRYNMLQAPCLQTSIDSGTQRTLLDVAGQPLYAWDADDRETEMEYDEIRRPLKRITENKELEKHIYGEDVPNAKEKNLRGQLYQHYDGSGFQQMNVFDFKGNPLETEQQLLDDATISDADWSLNPSLSTEVFTSIITYDALNRPITQTDPGGNVHEFTYDKGGFLKKVKLNTAEYVKDIHYDAKGQRQVIWYGNGTKTSYTYDEFTFRLRRLLTVNLNNNEILQDLNYWFDPVGNITEIQDDAQQTLFFNNAVIAPTQKFVYDALYRLIEAKGRELIGTADFGNEDNWNDNSWKTNHKGDGNAVQNYTQKYTYDEVGNILELQHIAGAGSYTRNYSYDVNSNKLLSTEVGSNTYSYSHDARGNMTEMPHLSVMNWNTQNELKSISKGSEPTYYQYSGGERVRKHTLKGNIKEERIYLGNYEIYRKYVNDVLDIERTTVHVSDDTGRIAMLEVRTHGVAPDDNNTAQTLTRYIYSNHLQSASLELDGSGEIISYEEYHPYGTTSYQAMNASINAVAKRYRYTGKERDEESGLYYHGARYYVPWLARWVSTEPLNNLWYNSQNINYENVKNRKDLNNALQAKYPTLSPYNYCINNPIKYFDPDGKDAVVSIKGSTITITMTNYVFAVDAKTTKAYVKQYTDYYEAQKGNLSKVVNIDDKEYTVNIIMKFKEGTKDDQRRIGMGAAFGRRTGENAMNIYQSKGTPGAWAEHFDFYDEKGADGSIWRAADDNRAVFHDLFHLLGFIDRYENVFNEDNTRSENIDDPNWIDDVMSNQGLYDSEDFDPVEEHFFDIGSYILEKLPEGGVYHIYKQGDLPESDRVLPPPKPTIPLQTEPPKQ